ncbi:hypothetical protein FA13DRAFT_1784879 [Coprinellus micaceus]|uniref:Asl1-like glycosyl hydrolase catalytic domain-containing protein n=1 Tax=Coprinellus micaceus TaxID=71717 RepID=A0A4Y7TYB0_COPMI|nr:hypothetical protein FA13DRAFT_1784879 [Coprinellus micaceus]
MRSIFGSLLYAFLLISEVYGHGQGNPTSTRTTRSSSSQPIPAPTAVKKNPKRGISVISWQYDWANIPPAYLATSNVKYIPMQWGSGSIDRFVDAGFNEPDFYNEANMDPADAARLWMQYVQPLKQYGVRLGGPAVTAGDTGRPWLQKFFAACGQCTIDFLPLHWYGSGTAGFYDYLWTIRDQFPNTSVWITEYADTSDDPTGASIGGSFKKDLRWLTLRAKPFAAVLNFMNENHARPKEGVHYNLLRQDGGLNALGELYVGAKTIHTQILSDTAYSGYRTVNGADLPNQPGAVDLEAPRSVPQNIPKFA